MKLLDRLSDRTRATLSRQLAWVAAGNIAVALLVPLITHAAFAANGRTAVIVVIYIALVAAGYVLRGAVTAELAETLDRAFLDRRRHLFDLLSGADAQTVERMRLVPGSFEEPLARLEPVPRVLIECIVSVVIIGVRLIAVAWLSVGACVVWLLLLLLGARQLAAPLRNARRVEERLSADRQDRRARITELLDGHAQLRLDARARAEFEHRWRTASGTIADRRRERAVAAHHIHAGSWALLFAGIGVLLVLGGNRLGLDRPELAEVTAMLLFIMPSLLLLVGEVDTLIAAEGALRTLDGIEAELGGAPSPMPSHPPDRFESIQLRGVQFSYPNSAFHLGPLDLEVHRGELVFIVGANGSGKTTLLKLLTGIYRPDTGRVELDGRQLCGRRWAEYRELFSVIFVDQHLFPRPYGLDVDGPARVEALLARFGLLGVVALRDGAWTTLDLSAGQRKRLAMVVALLEDRPVFVFDEWAAHQDPALRRVFYRELLPELKSAGRTVVAISHDGRFFDAADRRITLDAGRAAAPATARERPALRE